MYDVDVDVDDDDKACDMVMVNRCYSIAEVNDSVRLTLQRCGGLGCDRAYSTEGYEEDLGFGGYVCRCKTRSTFSDPFESIMFFLRCQYKSKRIQSCCHFVDVLCVSFTNPQTLRFQTQLTISQLL